MDKVVHFEIPAEDVERAKKFYGEIFGWKMNQMGEEMGGYVTLQTGPVDEKTRMPLETGNINGGMMKRQTIKSPVIVIAVEDTDATIEKVKARGGKLVGEVLDIPGIGRYAYVEDSEGNVIGVIKPIPPGSSQ